MLRQNPAYRPRESPLPTIRTVSRSFVLVAALGCSLLAACRGGTVPNQVLTTPAPASAPVSGARTGGPWSSRPSTRRQGFVVDQRAVITVRLAASTRTDTVSSHAGVTFSTSPSGSVLTGVVETFLVQAVGNAAAEPSGLPTPFPFRAEYPAQGPQLNFTAPADAVPCSSAALVVAQSLRDLWFRLPDTLRLGTAWEDSSSYVNCRDGVPLRVTVRRVFRVSGTEEHEGRLLLAISRVSRATIEGTGAQFGEPVTVSGAGSGQLTYELDPTSGEISFANGNSTLDLSLRSRLRTQVVRQTVELRIRRS
jgi:hypothetical protein